jgi:hypothetical protein
MYVHVFICEILLTKINISIRFVGIFKLVINLKVGLNFDLYTYLNNDYVLSNESFYLKRFRFVLKIIFYLIYCQNTVINCWA